MDNNNGNKSSGKGFRALILGFTVLILIVFAANTLYGKLSDGRKSEAAEKLVEDIAQNKDKVSGTASEATSESPSESNEPSESEPSENTQMPRAPEFVVYDNDGNEVKFTDKIGKPIIINFWATWCGPCKKEMPHFEKAYREYGDRIEFMMINPTDGINDTHESVDKFIEDYGYTFPVYRDTDVYAASVYGINSFPNTFFIDSDGYVLGYMPGSMDEETLYACIDILLGEE